MTSSTEFDRRNFLSLALGAAPLTGFLFSHRFPGQHQPSFFLKFCNTAP